MTETQNIEALIKSLENAIANSKDKLLIENWQRTINLLKQKLQHGRNNCNDDSSVQRESKQANDGRTFD